MSNSIRIVEVAPRDGLQNETVFVPTEAKLRLIHALSDAGMAEIEATSFVSPKWVPQLADAPELWPLLPPGPLYSALVPNSRGLQRAIDVQVDRIALFTAASDDFTAKNINMSIDQSLDVFDEIVQEFRRHRPGGWVRGYVSTAFECPYAGRIAPDKVAKIVERLLKIGVDEISIGDTIGVAVPSEVKSLSAVLKSFLPLEKFAYHFHDTRGTAVSNVAAALQDGVFIFDSSAGGLGGCPYAPGAGGNLATDDLVYFLERSGIPTGINPLALAQATLEVLSVLGREPASKGQCAQLSASAACPM